MSDSNTPGAPDSRIEALLATIAGETGIELEPPQSRIEEWLAYIAEHGSGGGSVDSVNGQTGAVVLDAEDVGAIALNQGSENAGKVLGIGANGIVTPVEGGGSMDISIIASEWDETASYVVGDYCTYDGKMWKALGSSVGESPAENEYWHSVSVESQLTHSYTELWNGTWGSGKITVPNTAKYNIFLIRMLSLGTLITFYKVDNTYVRGMGGYSSATPSISTYQFAAEIDGDEWTFIACNGIKHNKSGNHSEVTNYQVAQIFGFVYGG